MPFSTFKLKFLVVFVVSVCIASCSNPRKKDFAYSVSQDTVVVQVIDFKTPSPTKNTRYVYDTIAHFPKKGEWRTILMVQKIKCDESTNRDEFPCGEWDYTTETYIHTDKDKFQINNYVTPYGKGLNLTEEGWEYVWEVTDYSDILKGDVRITHGNNQELHDLKFVFIAGKPSRKTLNIDNIWEPDLYYYEKLALDSVLKKARIPVIEAGKSFVIKSRISGHGHFGPYSCCEWDEKKHTYRFSDEFSIDWTIWKDCAHNPIHPQGGTWQFDRSGWCPGSAVDTYNFDVTKYIKNDALTVDYQIEMFEDNGEKGGYFVMSHQLITYGDFNFNIDAEITQIKSPNNALRYRRSARGNDGTPILLVRNSGRHQIKNISFEYGVKGLEAKTYLWHGTLNSLEEIEIELPTVAMDNLNEREEFYAVIKAVNGSPDDQLENNFQQTNWDLPPVFPSETILDITTQDLDRAKENSYVLLNSNGTVIKERKEFPENTSFKDTLSLNKGVYTWVVYDKNEDGMILHWWKMDKEPKQIGRNGNIQFTNMKGDTIATPPFDFGDYYSFSFRVE